MKKIIAVVYGGDSDEWVISEKSAATVSAHLDRSKYEVYNVRMRNNRWEVILGEKQVEIINRKDFSFQLNGRAISFDAAFIVIHGTPGEDGKLQGYFDMIGLPYNTCNQLVSAVTFHKGTTIRLLKSHGFNCANSVVLRRNRSWSVEDVLKEVELPCFVKPNSGGSSFGISKVLDKKDLKAAIEKAFKVDKEVMVEELMKGREVTNGAFARNGQVVRMPITEIISNNEFFDYAAKYEGEAQEITPADLEPQITSEIQNTTARVYEKLNLFGLVRVDYILIEDKPYIIEVNTTPGLSDASLIPQQATYMGLSLKDLFGGILEEVFQSREDK